MLALDAGIGVQPLVARAERSIDEGQEGGAESRRWAPRGPLVSAARCARLSSELPGGSDGTPALTGPAGRWASAALAARGVLGKNEGGARRMREAMSGVKLLMTHLRRAGGHKRRGPEAGHAPRGRAAFQGRPSL